MLELSDHTFGEIASLMHGAIGLSFNPSKKALVASRLSPRIQRLGMDSFDDYLALIEGPGQADEFQTAVDLLTTNETYFFREPAHFELLEQVFGKGSGKRSVAAWSAASSYGDEAYSIAMVLADLQLQGHVGSDWSVLGTDISDRVLRAATEGVFPEERLRHVTPQRLKRYCLRGEGASEGLSQIQPKLLERVRFGQLNLCEPIADLGPFDVIFLRNVLIYFDAETKAQVVDRVLTQLRPGGLFFIGMAEGRVACKTPMQALAPGAFGKLA